MRFSVAGKFKTVTGRRRAGMATADMTLWLLSVASATAVLLMLLVLVLELAHSAMPSIHEFGWHFLVSSNWQPNTREENVLLPNGRIEKDEDGNNVTREIPPSFGALPVIYGTSMSSLIALIFAIPLSFGSAIFLVRIAPHWLVPPVSFLVEFLAAIPSIAYGIWGLFVFCPFLSRMEMFLGQHFSQTPGLGWLFFERSEGGKLEPIGLGGRNMLAGGLVLGIMILPIITAISRDVLKNVPRAQIEGTVSLGATWWESCKEMLKFSRSGLFGAVMLGLARAAGETMAVAMVIGNNSQIKASLFAQAQTMSSLLANEFAEATEPAHVGALTEVALILLLMSLVFNVVARWLVVGRGSKMSRGH